MFYKRCGFTVVLISFIFRAPASGAWTTIIKGSKIENVQMENKILVLETENTVSTPKTLMIMDILDATGNAITTIKIRFNDYKVDIKDCTSNFGASLTDSLIPSSATKEWYFVYQYTNLTIFINYQQVFFYNGTSHCPDKFTSSSSWNKVKFPEDDDNKDTVSKQYKLIDYYIHAENDTTTTGMPGYLQCQVYIPPAKVSSTTFENQMWSLSNINITYADNKDNLTYPVTFDDNRIFKLTLPSAPPATTEWTCSLLMTLDGTAQNISSVSKISIFTLTLSEALAAPGSKLTIGCTLTDASGTFTNEKIMFNSTVYSSGNLDNVTITLVSVGSGIHYLTGEVIAEKVWANLSLGVGCSLDLLGRTHNASGTLTYMSINTDPVPLTNIENLDGSINCTSSAYTYPGEINWWRKLRTNSSYYVIPNSNQTVNANENATSILSFSPLTEYNDTLYYCKATYPSTQVFAGGSVKSTAVRVEVIESGTPGICYTRQCSTQLPATSNCYGSYAQTTNCSYTLASSLSNNLFRTLECVEPNKGCHVTATGSNTMVNKVTGKHSTYKSYGSSYVAATITGWFSSVFITSTGEGNTESKSTNNNFTVNCSDATSVSETCSLTAVKGYYSYYYCYGPHCTITLTQMQYGYGATCVGADCSITDTNSNLYTSTCNGTRCLVNATGGTDSHYYVAAGATETVTTINKGVGHNVQTLGNNTRSVIKVIDSNNTSPECRGTHCEAYVEGGYFSTPICSGFNCTAKGKLVSNNGSRAKVECYGRDCHAICETSQNCTAQCNGLFCKATCLNNVLCNAICNGSYCNTVCKKSTNKHTCTELKLPKEATCTNCLVAPKIYNFNVCYGVVPKCRKCFAADYDLLGLTLYQTGCLDNRTTVGVCGTNTFIQACYINYCSDNINGCEQQLVHKMEGSSGVVLLSLNLALLFMTLACGTLWRYSMQA